MPLLSTSAPQDDFMFTAEYLNGKTLYWVAYDDFGYDDIGMRWNIGVFEFTSDTAVNFSEIDTPDSGVHNATYSILPNGSVAVVLGRHHFCISIRITNRYLFKSLSRWKRKG